jgi:hypothetical protein
MFELPFAFSTPAVLLALAALPALWVLLRVTPPQPRRIDFPPLRLILDLVPKQETPARTPWWLLLLRLVIAGLVVLAMAGPVWNARNDAAAGSGPLVVLLDSGWAAAPDWAERISAVEDLVRDAERSGRGIALVATGEPVTDVTLSRPGRTLDRLRALKPAPYTPDRSAVLGPLGAFLDREPSARVAWVSDGVSVGKSEAFLDGLKQTVGQHTLTVIAGPVARPIATAGANNTAAGLTVRLLRAEPNGRDAGEVRAIDRRGLPLGGARFAFPAGATETEAVLDLPVDLRNDIARLDVADERTAGAATLLDESSRRRRVGLVSGGTVETSQPLLSPTYYVARALAPFADVREPRVGPADAIVQLLDEKVPMIVLADTGTLPPDIRDRLVRYMDEGGLVLRFAGSRLAAAEGDDLVPVKLRRGGRSLGGALSWESPRTLAPFEPTSPFHGLTLPRDVGITRQLLAEPSADLGARTWASLADGTPIITADRRGKGMLVLVHVTADTTWSNLPLSGLFVDLMRRIVDLAGTGDGAGRATGGERVTVAPVRTLDGFGVFQAPPPTARPIVLGGGTQQAALVAGQDHPPGFYGSADTPVAVNTLAPDTVLSPVGHARLGVTVQPIIRPAPLDLRPWLIGLALLLFAIDSLAVLWLSGRLGRARRQAIAASLLVAALAGGLPGAVLAPGAARAAETAPISPKESDAALATRFAYVITGDATVDETSRSGLAGLGTFLTSRTALDPAEPAGVDIERDELAVYPLLYWPIVANRPMPGEAAIRRLDDFMKGGGTVIFDTRDALAQRPGGPPTPETLMLRRILAGVTVPELEPVPPDHVITKAFYLIETFPGRYADGQTWIEALPREGPDAERPARAGDGVSPIIITSNDLAAAWASGRRGEPLYPLVPGGPRQRELAFRAGVNIAMYALTGNYKADQVHVPALLERLGQ